MSSSIGDHSNRGQSSRDQSKVSFNELSEAVQSELPVGSRLGDYALERLLGAGAMGEVYLARQVRLDQSCAIKVLPSVLTRSRDFEKRFVQEGRSMAKLDHPHIVRVHNASVDADRHFIAMEYVPGGTLDDYLAKRGGKLSQEEALRLLSELLGALEYAHGRDVIHRDLKPANVLLTKAGEVKICDFGLSLVAGEEYMQSVIRESIVKSRMAAQSREDSDATIVLDSGEGRNVLGAGRNRSSSDVVGTPYYMSPEVQAGRAADARSDLYSLGVMAYRVLTGRLPMGMAKPPSRLVKGLDAKWDYWCERCMEMDVAERFASAGEALAALPGYVDEFSFGRDIERYKARIKELTEELKGLKSALAEERRRNASLVSDLERSEAGRADLREVALGALDNDVRILPEIVGASPMAPVWGKPFRVAACDLDMVWIEPGIFMMGSPLSEKGHASDESQHRVTLTKGYWLGKFPVTQKQWETVMGNNPSFFKKGRVVEKQWLSPDLIDNEDKANHPVERVSWQDATVFCKKLSEMERKLGMLPTGYEFSLPTEAQWEYACRAGTSGAYAGNGKLSNMGWFRDNSNDSTHAVGEKLPNGWGLYDMHGNVWEWCTDWYGIYSSDPVTDPTGAISKTRRIIRGGSMLNGANYCRTAFRYGSSQNERQGNLGFRLALRSIG
ncbi:MAG: SUMF1/EgtB/PvdO family nonheme iron enzyme [Opitutales bacterium]|nr:SUMF1/EgtB/PvdO family nonheme iron enzyme [Opitutales bacterium]